MLVHRLDTVLAQTDPFDLAQALERYIRAMSAKRIRRLVIGARDRIGEYYRTEFVALLEDARAIDHVDRRELDADGFVQIVRQAQGDDALRRAFARLLKSNLRAIPLFGTTFTEAVLENVPGDRTVAMGEEPPNTRMRALVIGGVAIALVFLGAAGEHVIATVRAQNALASPMPQVPAPILSLTTPRPKASHVAIVTARPSPSPSVPSPSPIMPSPSPTMPSPSPAAVAPSPAAVTRSAAYVAPSPPVQPKRTQPKRTPAPAHGVATIALPAPTPTPQPSDLDVTDMPDAFTDATAIPSQTPAPAEAPSGVSLKSPPPTPHPRSHSWFKRTILHLDPFKSKHP